jgi:hypothetical protein
MVLLLHFLSSLEKGEHERIWYFLQS